MSKLNYDIDAILTGEKQAWDKTVPSFTNEYETGFAGGRTLDQIRQLGAGLRQISISPGDNIQNAINKLNEDGDGGLVTLLPGTHDVDYDITLYSNITLQGLNAGASIIDFNSANFSILAKGSNAYTTGTISVTQGATTVTGSGTSWSSNITAGQNILISGIWYTITNVASDTSLSIAIPFASPTVSGGTYTVATTKSGIVIRELTVQFATGVGIDMQYNDNCNIEHVNIIGCGTGFRSQQASLSTVIDVVSIASGAGLVFNDSNLFQMQSSGALDTSSGVGVSLTSVTNADIGSLFAFNSSGDGIQMTNCENAAITVTSIGNGGQGIEFISGNKNIQLIAAAENNTSDGLKLTATDDENIITSGSYADNGGYGINIAAGTCDDNLIVSNVFSGNSSGAVNDSGTSTVIRGNVGVDDNTTSGAPPGFFGDGSDGALTTTGNVSLSRDMYYTNLTVASGHTITTNGYRIFVNGTCSVTGTIEWNGNAGTNASGGTGGSGASGLTAASLAGSVAGGAGGDGNNGNPQNGDAGSAGTAATFSISTSAAAGGAGGTGGSGTGGAGGAAGTFTESTSKPRSSTLLISAGDFNAGIFTQWRSSPGGGGGGAGGNNDAGFTSGGGGGGGSAGGVVMVCAATLTVNSGGVIQSNGGSGGNGGDGSGGNNSGGGGGGAGGNGGVILLLYSNYTNNGTVQAAAGTGGSGGTGPGAATDGSDGSNGNAGVVYTFEF